MFSNQTSLRAERSGTGHSDPPPPIWLLITLNSGPTLTTPTVKGKVHTPTIQRNHPVWWGMGTRKRWVRRGIVDVAPPLGSDRQPVTYLRDKASQRGDLTRPHHGNRLFCFPPASSPSLVSADAVSLCPLSTLCLASCASVSKAVYWLKNIFAKVDGKVKLEFFSRFYLYYIFAYSTLHANYSAIFIYLLLKD